MAKSGFKKASKDTRPKSSFEVAENQITLASKNQDPHLKKQRLDPLTERLGQPGYFHKMRWAWFTVERFGKQYPLEVSRYYEGIRLALDIGVTETKDIVELKTKILQAHDIKYKILQNGADLASLEGLQ